MTNIETKIEVEAEDFTEELSDEALDREGGRNCGGGGSTVRVELAADR